MTHPTDSPLPGNSPPDAKPKRVTPTRRLSGWVILLLFVIISGAFSFSAETWIGLAEIVGYRFGAGAVRLAWMLPVTVDGYLCLTTWLFLTASPGSSLRRYTGWSLLVVVVLSVVAQGVYHALDAQGVDVAQVWPLVVAVGGLAPALLASSVHLLSIYLHQPAAADASRPRQGRPPQRRKPNPAPPDGDAPRPTPPAKPKRLTVVPDAARGKPAEIDDEAIAEAIQDHVLTRRRLGAEPIQREMVRLVFEATGASVGQKRCVRVAKTISEGESESEDDKEAEAVAAI